MGKLITPAFLTDDQKGSPLGRIAVRAARVVKLVAERINAGRPKEQRIICPVIPTESDFYELLDLDVQHLRLAAQIEVAELYSAAMAFTLKYKLSQLEWKIAKRDMPDV